MFRFTISAGNFLIKVLYVLSIIGIIVGGIAAMVTVGFFAGLGILIGGFLLLIVYFWMLLSIAGIYQQVAEINQKLNSKGN